MEFLLKDGFFLLSIIKGGGLCAGGREAYPKGAKPPAYYPFHIY